MVQGRDKSASRTLVPSKVLPLIFDDVFFTKDLGLAPDEVIGFLEEMDKKLPSDRLLKKTKSFN